MNDCPNCEYHKQRAQLWRDEAYKQAGHPLPEREWQRLTDQEIGKLIAEGFFLTTKSGFIRRVEEIIMEKNKK